MTLSIKELTKEIVDNFDSFTGADGTVAVRDLAAWAKQRYTDLSTIDDALLGAHIDTELHRRTVPRRLGRGSPLESLIDNICDECAIADILDHKVDAVEVMLRHLKASSLAVDDMTLAEAVQTEFQLRAEEVNRAADALKKYARTRRA
jgi:hypothetical protein